MMTPKNPIVTPVADLWRDGEIIHILFKATTKHSIDEAQLVVKLHNQLSDGKKTPVLADLRGITTGADRKARKYYAEEESSEFKLGMAMLVDSPFQKMLGSIFMALTTPPYPTRMFNNERLAIDWLNSLASAESHLTD